MRRTKSIMERAEMNGQKNLKKMSQLFKDFFPLKNVFAGGWRETAQQLMAARPRKVTNRSAPEKKKFAKKRNVPAC